MQAHHDSRIPLDTVVELLTTNNPEMKELKFRSILINPTVEIFPNGRQQISHISDEDLHFLAEGILQNTTLEKFIITRLDLTFSEEWTQIGSEAIGDALKNHPKLKYVSLNVRIYGNEDKASIFGFLKCLTGKAKIEVLDLHLSTRAYSPIRDLPEILNEIGELLSKSQNPSLKRIYIRGDSYLDDVDPVSISLASFAKGLAIHKNLELIDFEYLPLSDMGIQEVARSFVEEKATPLKFRKI